MSNTTNRWGQGITTRDRHDVRDGVFVAGSTRDIAHAVIAAARHEETANVELRSMLDEAKSFIGAEVD